MSDTTQSIWRSASRFFSGTMLSRVSGLARDMAMAYAFGTQSVVAALLVAFRFAHLLRRLLGEGAMQTALIPHFEELRLQDIRCAGKFFGDLALSLTSMLIILTLIIMGGIGGLLVWDVLSPGNAEIAWFTFLMMPSLVFICLFGINAALLQCEKSYFIPSAAPIVFNLFWILGVACTWFLPTSQAMSFLSIFIVVACFAQWAFTLPKVYTILKSFGISHLWRGSHHFSKDVLRLTKPLTLGILGIAASQINNALDSVFARWADDEGPAFLWYAIRLQQLPLALFGIALAGALLPPLSRAIKANQLQQFRSFLEFSIVRTLAFMVPISILLLVLGDACVALIYGHGSFIDSSVVGTTLCLWGYSLGLIPMALVLILAPAFYAKGDYRTPSFAATASMGVNVLANTFLVAVMDLGAGSIAVATSISAWVNCLWLTFALGRAQPFEKSGLTAFVWKKCGLIALPSAVAGAAVLAFEYYVWGSLKAVGIIAGKIPLYEAPFMQQIGHLSINGLVFIGVFLLCGGLYPLISRKPALDRT